jgi:hypothetical protein
MGVRPPRNSEQQKSFNAFGERMMGRIYLLWLVGIFIGALSLRIQKYSVGGFEFSIENQDVLQGLVFCGLRRLLFSTFHCGADVRSAVSDRQSRRHKDRPLSLVRVEEDVEGLVACSTES